MRSVAKHAFPPVLILLALLVTLATSLVATVRAAGDGRWSVVFTTAPGIPQDIWITGMGNNAVGWNGGGCFCIGVLADNIPFGEHATGLANITAGGVVGPDGFPVPTGTYTFFDNEGNFADYTVTEGTTFYALIETEVVESNIDIVPVGTQTHTLFVFDYELGTHEAHIYSFSDLFGGGLQPFLDEGILKVVLKNHP